eukprot:1362189-Pleurochrysis_carterae.AAC.1
MCRIDQGVQKLGDGLSTTTQGVGHGGDRLELSRRSKADAVRRCSSLKLRGTRDREKFMLST